MKFSVPTNWQDDIPDKICRDSVSEVYGKLNKDFIGGGRASSIIPYISKKKAEQHIANIRRQGVKFNYLLNAVCIDNLEFTAKGQRRIRKLLDWLSAAGVDSITVAMPYLLELIKKNYPEFRIRVSTQAGVNSSQRAKYWEDLGADLITLSFVDVNRNFKTLRRIRESVSCNLQLIANLDCLYGCPFYSYHACLNAHASQAYHKSKGFFLDYCFLRCNQIKVKDSVKLISSPWIRPEDVHHYESLGINSIKLVNRTMSSDALKVVVDAYTDGKYDGNLLDLFSEPSKNLSVKKTPKFKYFFRPFSVNIFKLSKFRDIFTKRLIYIDNKSLDGFIEYFLDHDCRLNSCDSCEYCTKTAEKVLKMKDSYDKEVLSSYGLLLKDLISGNIFRYRQ